METDEQTLRTPMTLGPEDNGRLVTAEEFAEAEFLEPWSYEREGGRLLVMSPDGQRHVDGAHPWYLRLFGYLIDHPEIIDQIVPSAWVRVDDGTDRIGDIGIYLKSDRPVAPIPDRVPELVLEIVSTGRKSRERDYVTKRNEYQRLGVREYVIIDPKKRQVTVFSAVDGIYGERSLGPGETYTSALLPGLEIAIDDVFS